MAEKKEITKEAVRDFYGQYSPDAKIIWNYLLKRKRRPRLTEQQKKDLWYIRRNLSDPIYRRSTISSLKEK